MLPVQAWMAQIYVDDDGTLREFCKGALISAQWILTASACVYDPFEANGPERGESEPDYVVRFAGSDIVHEVESFVQSDDFVAGMMKLKAPVTIKPVAISKKSSKELLNANVFILGTESTAAIGDYVFSPNIGKRMYCRIGGEVFFRTGATCYVLAKSVKSTGLVETRAIVIDPKAPGAPNSSLDTWVPFDTSGSRLYLDFRAGSSYPCNEDLGYPVLRTNAAGTIELVGIVSGVGMAIGFPVCNPSLGNAFGTVSHYQDFIDTTIAQDAFNQLCPASPQPEVEYLGGNKVRLSWDPVAGAKGYRLMYTDQVGFRSFVALDVGNTTTISTEISVEPIYRVVLMAYNEVCSSPASDELAVAL
jgi:hypothetical protein